MIRSIPPTDGSTSFHFPRDRTMSIQTQMEQDFSQIPIPNPFPQEQTVKTSSSPCQFATENSIDSLTSPTTIQSSPTDYSDVSSLPDSAHTTLFFAGPTSQPYPSQDEQPSMDYQTVAPVEDTIQDAGQHPQYGMDSKSMIQMQFLYDENSMAPQQQAIQPLTYYDGVPYQVPMDHYYSPAPAWYTNIKPEETWPGLMPSERLQTYANWNQ
ncbi:MAG: hypothetical protein Q9170_004122 [Blastenia crenularia]